MTRLCAIDDALESANILVTLALVSLAMTYSPAS